MTRVVNRAVFCSFLLLAALNVWAAEVCVETEGQVVCPKESFRVLTDAVVDCRATRDKTQVKLDACDARKQALEAALLTPPTAQPTPVQKGKTVAAVTTAIIGAAALTAALAAPSVEPGWRVGIGLAGAAAITGSFIIAF